MRNFIRGFIAIWYLLGWMVHVYLGLFSPQIYAVFGSTALIPGYAALWQNWIMPNISFFALLLAVFEIVTGGLLISSGKWVKLGLVASVLFNLFLVQMGLGASADGLLNDFLSNRLANLVFIALQIPLFWGWDERSIPAAIAARFKRS
ncbi:MAG TPA: hypothetical protein PKW33_02835 [Anaerolineaceae bacterium]|nr:hypothetical protein [Anaerolineaceae bacterium]HPN50497.1 hypothetical protein [Anaerolineaceae bacterium]